MSSKSPIILLIGLAGLGLIGAYAWKQRHNSPVPEGKIAAETNAPAQIRKEPVSPTLPVLTNRSGRRIAPLPLTNAGGAPIRPVQKNEPAEDLDPNKLESAYRAQTNSVEKFEILDKLMDRGDLAALQAIERLFQGETDSELKVEMIDNLTFFEGNLTFKIQLLAQGIRSNQPKDVRQAAIDGLLDIDDVSAVPILQTLRNDPDEEIRDAAQDAIEFYKP